MEKTGIDARVLLKTENLIRDLEYLVNPPGKPIRCDYLRRLILTHHFAGVRATTLGKYAKYCGHPIRIRHGRFNDTMQYFYLTESPDSLERFMRTFSEILYQCYRKRMVATLERHGLRSTYQSFYRRRPYTPGIEKLVGAAELMPDTVFEIECRNGNIPTARVITWAKPATNRKTNELI